jgi:hypothetical protein
MAVCVCLCTRELAGSLPPEIIWRSAAPEKTYCALCALSAQEAVRLADHPLHCDALLVPEDLYSPSWQAQQVVSYGLSPRSSLTLSSMGQRDLLCVQRALTDCRGRNVEEQELCLPARWGVFSPQDRLLLAGTWLLQTGALPSPE